MSLDIEKGRTDVARGYVEAVFLWPIPMRPSVIVTFGITSRPWEDKSSKIVHRLNLDSYGTFTSLFEL